MKIEKTSNMPVMFFSHDHWAVPCGRWDSIKSDDTGLYVTGRVNTDLESGKEIYSALKFGSMSGLSVGFSFNPDGVEEMTPGALILSLLMIFLRLAFAQCRAIRARGLTR